MKQQKNNWVKILFSFAAPCKGKMALSVFCAILSVAGGFIPFWAVYEILLAFINQNVTLNGILIWCLVGAAGYLLRVACHGISTILAHISAYTILEGIRLKIADRLMKAPLGEVMGRRIGYLKNIIMDKVEDLEPPLAHMIPELTSNLLLPVAIFTWMMVIDWRMGLAVLIAPVLAMIPMFFLMRNYNSQYAAYMEANNHVNSIIIEYVEGIEVVKAFNQSTSSYEKFVNAVQSFKEFTLAWFKSTWKTMNLMMAIMPTTLLGVLPVGLLLVQNGSISPAELACSLRMGEILGLTWENVHISDEDIAADNAYVYIDKELTRASKRAIETLGEKDIYYIFTPLMPNTSTRIVLKKPKTDSSIRKVWLPKTLAYILREWKKSQDELKGFLGDEYQDFDLVVALPNGRPCEDRIILKEFAKLREDAGLPKVVFHSLRHSSTTYKLKLNHGDLKATQGDTGHAEIDMITSIYAHILDEDRKVNAQKFETAFYAKPDLRNVRPPEEPAKSEPATLDLESLVEQLQKSPELASALAALIAAQAPAK